MTKEEMLLSRTPDEKRNIIKVWQAYLEKLPEVGQEIIQDQINWLEASIPEEIKKKKKKKKKIKKGGEK